MQPLDPEEMKSTSREVFEEDDTVTAAPSLWVSRSGADTRHGDSQSRNFFLPDILPTLDCELPSEKLPHPTACMISSSSSEMDGRLHMAPCTTPRSKSETPTTPPPRPMPEVSAMLKALNSKSVDSVREALLDEPWAAQKPLSETHEPPLCAAVRLGSIPEIIELLLAHGADVNAADCHGQTPLRILESCLSLHKFEVDQLGAKDVELPEALCRSKELLQVQAGVLEDDPSADQEFEIGINSSVWNRLPSGSPPFVNNIDLFQHFMFMSSAAFARQAAHTH